VRTGVEQYLEKGAGDVLLFVGETLLRKCSAGLPRQARRTRVHSAQHDLRNHMLLMVVIEGKDSLVMTVAG